MTSAMPSLAVRLAIGVVACTALVGPLEQAGAQTPEAALPPRPEAIEFAPLEFRPPEAARFRCTLPDGTVVYAAPSHEFPLITLSITFKGGAALDPPDVPGLVAATARLMREGGTAASPPAAFDEELDFLATEIGVSSSDAFTTVTMNCLADTFDDSLRLFVEMLRQPRFDAGRLVTAQARQIEALKQRNDDASSIVSREWKRLLWGPDHFEGRDPTAASVAAMTRERMADIHRRMFHPGNMIASVSGDFDEPTMLAKLARAFAGWEKGPAVPDPAPPRAKLEPGLYHVPKDIPQGKVVIGMRSITRDDPDAIPLLILNDILGGGGFTSRIMQQVRSNEGLAYSAGSAVAPKVWYPGQFQARFESKNATVALATKIIIDLVEQVRNEPVTYEELETAKRAAVETFPRQFESKPAMLRLFVNDEWTKRPPGYWQSFRDKVSAVTREDLQRVARKHLDPEQMAILVVGDWEEIAGGDLERRASMKDFFGGRVTHLPLRDPLTLEPLPAADPAEDRAPAPR
jgi:zinc protease